MIRRFASVLNRFRRHLLTVAAVASGVVAAGLTVSIPPALDQSAAFDETAVQVTSRVVDRNCVPVPRGCGVTLRFTVDGVEHTVNRAGRDRRVGDQVVLLVDPDDPTRVRSPGVRTAQGTSVAFGAVGFAGAAAILALMGVPARGESSSVSGARVLWRRPARWAVAPAAGVGAGLAAVIVAGAAGWSDPTGVVVTVAGGAAGAAVGVLWSRRRPSCLRLEPGQVTLGRGDGGPARLVTVGPHASYRVVARRHARSVAHTQFVIIDDTVSTMRVWVGSWGCGAGQTTRRLVTMLDAAGARRER